MTGEALRLARLSAGISEKTAAASIGVPALRLARFESGKASPTRAQLIKLARLYRQSYAAVSGLTRTKKAPRPKTAASQWYMRSEYGRTIVYSTDAAPKIGLPSLVRRGGDLYPAVVTRELLDSGEAIVACAVKVITAL